MVANFCVFVGPTRLQKIPDRAQLFAPAALGSVFRAVEAGYKLICLIDGYFGNTPSLWHKEILFALKQGVRICGSSSTGALRAAELHPFGMIGFGWVYRAFRRGILLDDDEVCVLHAIPELHFEPLSEAMVNIRYSLRRMLKLGRLSRESEERIVFRLKQLHFSTRTLHAVQDAFDQEFGAEGSTKFAAYQSMKIDIKALDAALMLNAVASAPMAIGNNEWHLPMTNHWVDQFLLHGGDIPPLRRWHPPRERA
jgi:hypothetical protein